MNKLGLAGLVFLLCLASLQFGFSSKDIISSKVKPLGMEDIERIKDFKAPDGYTFQKMIEKLGYSEGNDPAGRVYVMGELPDVIVQTGGSDQLNFIFKCKRNKCDLKGGILYMKPIGEVMELPKKNAQMGLSKKLSRL